jgi:DNA-binding NarL/FixJ family response regulator
MPNIKVIIVDDHQIIRDGVKNMIADEEDICFVGCASTGVQALEMIRELKPDVVISDISMPDMNGIELARAVTDENHSAAVLILSMYTTDDYVYNAIRAGARGILPKQDTSREMLLEAIRTLHSGEEFYSPAISKNLLRAHLQAVKKPGSSEKSSPQLLTQREKEILKLYVEGYSNAEVADKLSISIRTVETHKNNIMQKFAFKSTVEMVKFALKNNIVSL